MTTTDPTIAIAGLRATIEREYYREQACTMAGEIVELQAERRGHAAERDALAAQLAEARAALAAAPKVCAIHSYALEGPCMTCGAPWPGAEKALRQERVEGMEKMRRISAAVGCPNSVEEVVEAVAAIKSDLASERARLAAYKERIAGLEQAANERSRTGQVSEPERSEWIGAAVAVADALGGSLGPVSGTSGTIDPREWIHFAAGLADRAKKLTARMAELEARPVLTHEILSAAIKKARKVPPYIARQAADEYMPHLGPVTLPAPDRAEELFRAYLDAPGSDAEAMRHALDALAKLSPAPAPALDAAFLRRILSATKHGPGGKGDPGICDAACVKCEAERIIARLTAGVPVTPERK